jgi:GcrA cell cycle regulator
MTLAKWSDDRNELLRAMWLEGKRPPQIAKVFGTCSSVIRMKRHELNLPDQSERWPQERVELFKELWPHHPASEIGKLFGISRSAVCGKAMRMGLAKRADPAPKRFRHPRIRKPRVSIVKKPTNVIALAPVVKVEPRKIPLTELTRNNCHWPCDEVNGFTVNFCGNDSLEGLPYCATHAQVAYRK